MITQSNMGNVGAYKFISNQATMNQASITVANDVLGQVKTLFDAGKPLIAMALDATTGLTTLYDSTKPANLATGFLYLKNYNYLVDAINNTKDLPSQIITSDAQFFTSLIGMKTVADLNGYITAVKGKTYPVTLTTTAFSF